MPTNVASSALSKSYINLRFFQSKSEPTVSTRLLPSTQTPFNMEVDWKWVLSHGNKISPLIWHAYFVTSLDFNLGSVPGSWALAAATPPSLYSAWGWRGTPRDHRTAQFCGRFRLMRRDLSCFCGSGYSQHCPHRRVGTEQYNGHFVKLVIFIIQ